jgi:LacI family transcriptional regulator
MLYRRVAFSHGIAFEYTCCTLINMAIIDDIAKEVGVSRITVQRVLNGSLPYARAGAAARAEHIRKLAQTLNWRPHAGARATASGRFGAIAMLTRAGLGPTQDPVAVGAHDALAAHGLRLVYALVEEDDNGVSDRIPQVLAERSVDGVLVNLACFIPPALVRALRRTGLPTVTINSDGQNDCVLPDDAEAGSRLVQHLYDAGHRAIAYATVASMDHGLVGHYSLTERQGGYRRACIQLDLPPLVIEAPPGRLPLMERIAAWRRLLQTHHGITAWIVYQHRDVGALVAAATGLGLEIPRDISLAGFRFESQLDGPGGTISAMMIPFRACGQQAANMLIGRLANGGKIHQSSVRVRFDHAGAETIAHPRPLTSVKP